MNRVVIHLYDNDGVRPTLKAICRRGAWEFVQDVAGAPASEGASMAFGTMAEFFDYAAGAAASWCLDASDDEANSALEALLP